VLLSRFFSSAFAICALSLATSFAAARPEAFVVVDSQTGYVLLEQNSRDKRQIGSLTKVATACVVFDWAEKKGGDLNQLASITESAFRGAEKNEIGWQPGDTTSLRDLLYASLVQSDNIAANALAEHVGEALISLIPAAASGKVTPVAAFVAQMNALAKQLKMERTLFANPTGFDQKERPIPYSTALDLARLTRYAMSKASFRFYVSQKAREIALTRAGQSLRYLLQTTNELLGTNGIDGVKTGMTARAGECLILSANRESEIIREGATTTVYPRHMIVVLLSSPDRFGHGAGLVSRGWQWYDQWAASGRPVDPKRVL
jgi:D-alanyl-D-alanine carboxypeptidase (penicillin-binding protein 5/6)